MRQQQLHRIKLHLLAMVNDALHARSDRSLDKYIGFRLDEGVEVKASDEELDDALRKITEFHLLDSRYDDALCNFELALDRLNTGTYGICVTCRGDIEPEVLEEDPTVRVCRHCFATWRKFQ